MYTLGRPTVDTIEITKVRYGYPEPGYFSLKTV